MSYLERIQNDLTAAMKEKNELRLSVLRMMKSALKLKEVEKMKPLDDLESHADPADAGEKGEKNRSSNLRRVAVPIWRRKRKRKS